MRIYLFEHKGTHYFVLAHAELAARSILRDDTHDVELSQQAVYVNSAMSFSAVACGNDQPWVVVEPL